MKSKFYLLFVSFLSASACMPNNSANKDITICLAQQKEQTFFKQMGDVLSQLGYHPWMGTATDDHGYVTTVMRAKGWITDIWVQNAAIFPPLNNPNNPGEVIPSHTKFTVNIHSVLFGNSKAKFAYDKITHKMNDFGYVVNNLSGECIKRIQ